MDDAVEIVFRTDLSEPEAGAAAAVSLLRDASGQIADAFRPDTHEASVARRIADERIEIFARAAREEISAEEQKNNFLLRLGEESLDEWKAQAVELENARFAAEQEGLRKREAADAADKVARAKDRAQVEAAAQDHANRLASIDQSYEEKKRQIGQSELQDFIRIENDRLNAAIRKLDEEYRAHQISAQQKRDAEVGLTIATEAEVLKRFDAENASLEKGTLAWAKAMKDRAVLVDQFSKHVETADNQLAQEESQKWTQLGHSIESSFNSALDQLVFHGETFKQFMGQVAVGVLEAFLHMGEQILENWIETQIEQMFITRSTQSATALGQITDNAAVAASGAAAATAMIPIVGPLLAPAAAATTFADTMSWAGALAFDVGAWELPHDMPGMLHKGEMVVPTDFASGLRGNGGMGGMGGGQHFNFSNTFNHNGGGEWSAEEHARDIMRVARNAARMGRF
ncbi:MAG TPA: hypothetical protein VGI20_10990 [Rhizomicrobium sp.]